MTPLSLTLDQRVRNYGETLGRKWPASTPTLYQTGDGALAFQGFWVIGNDYRNASSYHGAYPRGYLTRMACLFPDTEPGRLLHAFSGSLPKGPYVRCDLMQPSELACDVIDLPNYCEAGWYTHVYADPPYTKSDASKYGTPMINRGKATAALAVVVAPGGFLIWLDTVWPMHRKALWRTVGQIAVRRSTNHVMRLASVFQRTEVAA